MTPAVAARVAQLGAERDYRRSVAEFRQQREAARQARVASLLTELVAALSQLPLEPGAWPNQYTKRSAA